MAHYSNKNQAQILCKYAQMSKKKAVKNGRPQYNDI